MDVEKEIKTRAGDGTEFCGRVTLMDTKQINREQISALADGELVDADVSVALATLRRVEEQETWDLYHQIGDVLRSEEMAFSLSDGFAAKMSARLDAEPAIIATPLKTDAAEQPGVAIVAGSIASRKRLMRRFVMPGTAVAAAVAAVVFVTAPQQSAKTANIGATTQLAANPAPIAATKATLASSQNNPVPVSNLAQQGEVTRDPRIDDYLLAHQHFSPSMYSSVQYARSAAFAIDSDK